MKSDKGCLQKNRFNLLKTVDLPNEDLSSVCKELFDVVDPLHHGVGLYNPMDKPKPLVRGWIEAGPDIQKPNSPNQLVEKGGFRLDRRQLHQRFKEKWPCLWSLKPEPEVVI